MSSPEEMSHAMERHSTLKWPALALSVMLGPVLNIPRAFILIKDIPEKC